MGGSGLEGRLEASCELLKGAFLLEIGVFSLFSYCAVRVGACSCANKQINTFIDDEI